MIKIETYPTDSPLTGQSKWWGQPELPDNLEWPEVNVVDEAGEEYSDPLTFVCQLRCDELAPFDPEGLLPHEGMLYFFAALDYFLGDLDTPAYPGMGQWRKEYFRVLYAPTCEELHTHQLNYPDGSAATLPAETIILKTCSDRDEGLRLLGTPYIDEVREDMPGWFSLLQVEENDRWGLTFHDCGLLHFLITPDDLQQRRWDRVACYLFSF